MNIKLVKAGRSWGDKVAEAIGPSCSLCGEPLAGEEWVDDEEYGDAHVRCIKEKRGEA